MAGKRRRPVQLGRVKKSRMVDATGLDREFVREVLKNPRTRLGSDMIDETTRVVPVFFPGFNRAITCGADSQPGGYPLGTTGIVHGPASGGKTTFLLGLALSFQRAGGSVGFVDAERVLHWPWVWRLGLDPKRFFYLGKYHWAERTQSDKTKTIPPLHYEDAIMEVDGWISAHVTAAKMGRKIGPFLIIVDSLKKLTPKGFATAMMKKGGNVRGTALGREQAAYNTGWVADLGPKICDHDISVVFVQHEGEGPVDHTGHMQMKLRGGQGIQFDASVILRLGFGAPVYDTARDADAKTPNVSVGKKHRGWIEKNKIGPHRFGSASSFEFFVATSDGICPIGWDRPRELLCEALRRGVADGVKWDMKFNPTLGAKFVLGNRKLTLKSLYQHPEIVDELEEVLRV